MRVIPIALTAAALFVASATAYLPKIAVISIDNDEFAPDLELIESVIHQLVQSGRFDLVDLGSTAILNVSPDSLLSRMTSIAVENGLDTFLALELLPVEDTERTIYRNDSLLTFRSVQVTVLGRFYSSSGTLIGTISQTRTAEDVLPYSPDPLQMARQAAVTMAERSILELFPLEVSFLVSGERSFTIPIGTLQGVNRGTVMSVVASSTTIPSDASGYADLRSHALLQVTGAGGSESTARLLSGHLIEGARVTAVEQSAPAVLVVGYSGGSMDVIMGSGLDEEAPSWINGVRVGVATGKWGLSFGGGISAGALERGTTLGVDLSTGFRIPVASPSLGLRLTAGVEMLFLMQDVRSDTLSSNATAVAVDGVADASLEWLFSDHLGIEMGLGAALGGSAERWTVQEYTGKIRDANPDELYYTSLRKGPLTGRLGLFYLIF